MKYANRFLTAALAGGLFFSGCGSSSNGGDEVEKISLVRGEAVSVYPGDSITPGGDDTQIAIRHEVGEEVKSVTLLQGSAQLLLGDYQVE